MESKVGFGVVARVVELDLEGRTRSWWMRVHASDIICRQRNVTSGSDFRGCRHNLNLPFLTPLASAHHAPLISSSLPAHPHHSRHINSSALTIRSRSWFCPGASELTIPYSPWLPHTHTHRIRLLPPLPPTPPSPLLKEREARASRRLADAQRRAEARYLCSPARAPPLLPPPLPLAWRMG